MAVLYFSEAVLDLEFNFHNEFVLNRPIQPPLVDIKVLLDPPPNSQSPSLNPLIWVLLNMNNISLLDIGLRSPNQDRLSCLLFFSARATGDSHIDFR